MKMNNMINNIKTKQKKYFVNNNQGGFLKLIVVIIIALFLMSYFHITFGNIIDWVKKLLSNVS